MLSGAELGPLLAFHLPNACGENAFFENKSRKQTFSLWVLCCVKTFQKERVEWRVSERLSAESEVGWALHGVRKKRYGIIARESERRRRQKKGKNN